MRGGPVSRILSRAGRSLPLDDHSSEDGVATAPLAANPDRRAKTCLRAVSGKPDLPRARSLFGIAPGGACRAGAVASPAVGSYPTVSPLLARAAGAARASGLFSVALSLGLPQPGVTRHRCLVESGLSSPAGRNPPKRPSSPPRTPAPKRPRRPGQRQTARRYRPARSCRPVRAAPSPRDASAVASRAARPRR